MMAVMRCVAPAAVPALGVRAPPRLGDVGGGAKTMRLRHPGDAALRGKLKGWRTWAGGMAAMRCVAAAAVPAWGTRAPSPLGAGGVAAGRLRLRRRNASDAALCPPSTVHRNQNFRSWCKETGREAGAYTRPLFSST